MSDKPFENTQISKNITTDFMTQLDSPDSGWTRDLLISILTAGVMGLSLLLVLYKTMKRKTKEKVPLEKMVSIVVNEKEGIRELNPHYKTLLPTQNVADVWPFNESFCETILKSLEESPNKEIYGWHKSVQDPYQWITTQQFQKKFTEFGSGLETCFGISPGSHSRVGIYGINCIEWMVAHYGLLMYSNTAVPLYNTLGKDAMIHIVGLTKMTVCICFDETKAQHLLQILDEAQMLSQFKGIVLMRTKSSETAKKLENDYPSIQINFMEQIQESGRQKILPYCFPKDDDLYIINFTSGTTSVPKGVMITCKMVKRIIESSQLTKPLTQFWTNDDTYYSFLPLAHVLEQIMLALAMFLRCRVGFFSGDVSKFTLEVQVLRPTCIALVPRLLIKIYDETMKAFSKHRIPEWLIKYAIHSKINSIAKYGPQVETIWDKLFFKKVKNVLGGKLKFITTGSASCPEIVTNFSRAAFGAVLYVGYGATETCGPVTLTFPEDVDPDHVGGPIHGVQVKLADVPDMNLFPSRPNGNGRGEICTRGQSCTLGYFEDPEKTKDLIDSDGWLHSGDVGEWDEFGRLKIVDRCKNIFKLCQGEYIAPDKVENIYLNCAVVDQVFVDGRSDQSFAIAIVHPNFVNVCKQLSISFKKDSKSDDEGSMSAVEICQSERVRQHVLKEMNELGKSHQLASFEMAKKLFLVPYQFSLENQMMTSTMKLIRPAIRTHFKKEIDQMYLTCF